MVTSLPEDAALSSSSSLSVDDLSRSMYLACEFGDMNRLADLFCDDDAGVVFGFGVGFMKSGIRAAAPSLSSHFGGFFFRPVRLGKREVVVVRVVDVVEGGLVGGAGFGFVACVSCRLGLVFGGADAREAWFWVRV